MAQSFYKKALGIIANELAKDAKDVLKECVQEIDYTHRTKNLYDSYGYGVYVQGKLTKIGFLSSSPQATKTKKWYGKVLKGRDEITDYLRNDYKPKGVIDLAVAAAMPYAKVLEAGGGGISKKYRVISMSFQKLQELARKYNGNVNIIRQ